MKKLFFLPLLPVIILLCSANILAQDDDYDIIVDSSVEEMMDQIPLIIFSKSSVRVPVISINYGFVTPFLHKDAYGDEFNEIFRTNSINIRLGIGTIRPLRSDPDSVVFRHSQSLLSITNYSTEYGSKESNVIGVASDCWSFGLECGGGYGFKSGVHDFLYLNSITGLTWTVFDFKEKGIETDRPLPNSLETFEGQARFGNSFEASIGLYPIENLGITVGYERAMTFPRHMFWYWAGSSLIQGVANGLGDWFSKEVIKKSPVAGAMMHFVLNNAINYGFYELRKKAMNWPFDTAHPFLYDSFKIGLSLKF